MLTSISVSNWKSFDDATLNIDPFTVLIGTNSSGKSNLLDALLFMNRISSGALLSSALQGDGVLSALRGGLDWAARKPGDIFSIKIVYRASEAQDIAYKIECKVKANRCELFSEQMDRIKYRVDKNDMRKNQIGSIRLFWTEAVAEDSPTIICRLYNEKAGTTRQLSRSNAILFQLMGQKVRSEIQDGIDSVLPALRNIFVLDPIPSHMRGFSPLSDRLDPDAGNIAGVIAALPEKEKLEMEATLTEYVSKLPEKDIVRVYAETVGRFNADAMLYCEEAYDGVSSHSIVDSRGMSDGTLRFLAILTALLTRPTGSLLVIEEVDNGLHPSRSSLLLQMLSNVGAKRGVDILVTTHNPALLDAMGTKMVPFISVAARNIETGNSTILLLEEIDQLPKLLAQGPVGRLSSSGLIERAIKNQQGEV